MLTLSKLRTDRKIIIQRYSKRGLKPEMIALIDKIISDDDQRKSIQTELDESLAKGKKLSKQIGDFFKSGQADKANAIKEEVAVLKQRSKELEQNFKDIKLQIEDNLLNLPNVPHESVPAGNTEADNEVFKAWTQDLPEKGDHIHPHWDLAKKYDLIDLELGAFITGSGFPLFRGKGAKLKRALINFFLDEADAAGYEEVRPPFLVNEESAKATGQLPDKKDRCITFSWIIYT